MPTAASATNSAQVYSAPTSLFLHTACLRMACMRAGWCSRHHFPGCTVPWLERCTRGICAVGIGSSARGRFECEELHEEGPSFLPSRVGVCEVYIVYLYAFVERPCPSLVYFLRLCSYQNRPGGKWQTRDSTTSPRVARYAAQAQISRLW